MGAPSDGLLCEWNLGHGFKAISFTFISSILLPSHSPTIHLHLTFSDPSKPPDNFKVVHKGSTKLRASWNKVPKCCQLGIIRGYHVTLTDPSNASVHETRTTENLIQTFTNLKKFHLYNVSVVAFTSKGVGPMNFILVSTDQDGK